jgi:hypothetical protein
MIQTGGPQAHPTGFAPLGLGYIVYASHPRVALRLPWATICFPVGACVNRIGAMTPEPRWMRGKRFWIPHQVRNDIGGEKCKAKSEKLWNRFA